MKTLVLFIPILLTISVSCSFNSDKIASLEFENRRLRDSINKKDSLYDSIKTEYWELRNKVTKHKKYYYTVYDDVIIDENGDEWEINDFFREYYEKGQVIDMFDINLDDFESDYYSDYDRDNYDNDDLEHYEPRAR